MTPSKKTRPQKQRAKQKTSRDKSLSEITIELDFGSSKIADSVYDSILPETKQPLGFRSRTTLSRKDKILRLTIKSKDIVALRASSSAFLRFVAAAIKTLNVLAPFYSAEPAAPSNRRERQG